MCLRAAAQTPSRAVARGFAPTLSPRAASFPCRPPLHATAQAHARPSGGSGINREIRPPPLHLPMAPPPSRVYDANAIRPQRSPRSATTLGLRPATACSHAVCMSVPEDAAEGDELTFLFEGNLQARADGVTCPKDAPADAAQKRAQRRGKNARRVRRKRSHAGAGGPGGNSDPLMEADPLGESHWTRLYAANLSLRTHSSLPPNVRATKPPAEVPHSFAA